MYVSIVLIIKVKEKLILSNVHTWMCELLQWFWKIFKIVAKWFKNLIHDYQQMNWLRKKNWNECMLNLYITVCINQTNSELIWGEWKLTLLALLVSVWFVFRGKNVWVMCYQHYDICVTITGIFYQNLQMKWNLGFTQVCHYLG